MTTYTKETALYDTGAISGDINAAGTTATKYITTVTSDGIMVADDGSGTTGGAITSNTNGVHISDDVDIVREGVSVANYGETARIGKEDESHFEVSSDGMRGYSPVGSYFEVAETGASSARTIQTSLGEWDNIDEAYESTISYNRVITISSSKAISPNSSTTMTVSPNSANGKVLRVKFPGSSNLTITSTTFSDESHPSSSETWPTATVTNSWVEIAFPSWTFNVNSYKERNFTVNLSMTLDGSTVNTYIQTMVRWKYANSNSVSWWTQIANNDQQSVQYQQGSITVSYTATTTGSYLKYGTNAGSKGIYSSSLGEGLMSQYDNQTVIGKYNSNGNNAFEIGNGTADNARSNALAVDWDGYLYRDGETAHIGSYYYNTKANLRRTATSVDTFLLGASVTLPPGIYVIVGRWVFNTGTSGVNNRNLQVTIGSGTSSIWNFTRTNTYTYAYQSLECTLVREITSTTTVYVMGSGSQATNTSYLDSSRIDAIKIV